MENFNNFEQNLVIIIIITIVKLHHSLMMNSRAMSYHSAMAIYHYNQCLLLKNELNAHSVNRSLWTYYRSSKFWEEEVARSGEKKFKEDFRLNSAQFSKLCKLMGALRKTDTNYRNCIPFEKRIAIALYTLGSSSEYRTIANLFGVGRTTVGEICLEFCREVWRTMSRLYIPTFPLCEGKVRELIRGFENMGFPQCIGAIDGSHVKVSPPAELATDYYNYKGWYSTVLLALVDYRYRFIYINVGAPGRCNDSQIFENSQLFKYFTTASNLQQYERTWRSKKIPVFMIGDSAFRLTQYMMKPYPFGTERNEKEKNFNYSLSRSRRVVENAFGHLKARFRRLGKGLEVDIDNVNTIIKACCVLHNFLNEERDHIPQRWIRQMEEMTRRYEQPVQNIKLGDHDLNAIEMRKTISEFLSC